jgi:hypothetical protein
MSISLARKYTKSSSHDDLLGTLSVGFRRLRHKGRDVSQTKKLRLQGKKDMSTRGLHEAYMVLRRGIGIQLLTPASHVISTQSKGNKRQHAATSRLFRSASFFATGNSNLRYPWTEVEGGNWGGINCCGLDQVQFSTTIRQWSSKLSAQECSVCTLERAL